MKSRFLRDLLTLFGGGGMAQLINALAIPLATQFYSPAEFGLFSLFIAVTTLFLSLSTGRYEHAVMLPKEEETAFGLVRLALAWCAGMSLALGGLSWWLGPGLTGRFGHPELAPLLAYSPAFLLAVGCFSTLTFWFNRHERYRVLAASKVVQACVTAGAWVSFGVARWSAAGLVLGNILGWVGGGLCLAMVLVRRGLPRLAAPMAEVARAYRSFPLYAMPAGTLHFLSANLSFFVFGYLYSAAEVGQFSLAYRALCAPVVVTHQAFQQVVSKELTRNPDRPRFYLRQYAVVLGVLGAMLVPVSLAGPWLFRLVFGPEWLEAGRIARWLAFWVLVSFATESLTYAFAAAHRNAVLLLWRVGYLAGLVALFGAAGQVPLETAVQWYAMYGVVAYALLGWLGWLAARSIPKEVLLDDVPPP
ncbi:MAG: oligosaccharide flippase family protein [Candidatus Eremiobacterota bacterium]